MTNKSVTGACVPNETGEKLLSYCNGKNSLDKLIGIAYNTILASPISDSGPNTLLFDVLGFITLGWSYGVISLRSASQLKDTAFSEDEKKFISMFESEKGSTFAGILKMMNIDSSELNQISNFPVQVLISSLIKGGLLPIKE